MSNYDIIAAMHRLQELGVDTSELNQDYYKIPLENLELSKFEVPAPNKSKVVSKHTIIVDSRQRDYSLYNNPNNYSVNVVVPYRNVERIELIAAMMPKTEYNITTENNLILLTISGIQEELYLTEGQYIIGSNIQGGINYISNGDPVFTGIMSELLRVLNTHTLSTNAFNVFLATVPGPNGTGLNASILNRLVITNENVDFSIDFTNTNYSLGSPFRILGFPKSIVTSNLTSTYYGSDNIGTCSASDLQNGNVQVVNIPSIQGIYDYDLMDDPKYIIMQLDFGGNINNSAERIESIDIATNKKFAIVIYDSNDPDNISNYNSSITYVQDKTDRKTGRLKALKGSDFDKKIITFNPPVTLENLQISFYKYNNTFYQFHNKEHLLTFEIDVVDFDPRYKY
jgi:hypothetical protein